MYFYFFDRPSQVTENSVSDLASFIRLLDFNSGLYVKTRDAFKQHDTRLERIEEKSYQRFIYESDSKLKRKFVMLLNKQIHGLNTEFSDEFEVFYRGVSNKDFSPIPSIYRNKNFDYENTFIDDIRVSNPDLIDEKAYIDELSTLQHYGCPTRLMDLTRNPLVALYFACEDAIGKESTADGNVLLFLADEGSVLHSNSDKVLILTAVSHLSKKCKDELLKVCDEEVKNKGYSATLSPSLCISNNGVKKLYQEISRVANFDKKIKCMDLLQSFYVQPAYKNLRIRAQSGLFVINGLCQNVKECASRNENKIFAKINIPSSAKKRILRELDSVGINRKTLFPEIEDTIRYLKEKYI